MAPGDATLWCLFAGSVGNLTTAQDVLERSCIVAAQGARAITSTSFEGDGCDAEGDGCDGEGDGCDGEDAPLGSLLRVAAQTSSERYLPAVKVALELVMIKG